jgi:hypothetical protein
MSKAKSDFCILRLQGNKIKGFVYQWLKLSKSAKRSPRHNVVFSVKKYRAQIFSTFKEPRNRFRQPMYPGGPVRQLAESIPWNRFLGSLKVKKSGSGIYLPQ